MTDTDSGVLLAAKVTGRARTKGSLKPICTRDRKHTVYLSEQVQDSGAWRKLVARRLREAQLAQHGEFLRYAGPVEVRLVFFMPRTAAVAGGPIPTHDTEWPTAITVGDIDKLTRNVLDAMLTPKDKAEAVKCSALLADDSQVVLLSVGKFWVPEGEEPGVQILVLKTEPEPIARVLLSSLAQGEVPVGIDRPETPCGCPYFRGEERGGDSAFCACGHESEEHEFGDGACAERS